MKHATIPVFALLTLSLAAPAMADPSPGEVVDRFFAAYRAGDVQRMLDVYAPDAVFEDVAQRHRVAGAEELRVFLGQLMAMHKTQEIRENRRVVAGQRVVVDYLYTGEVSGAALSQIVGKEGCQDTRYELPVTTWYEVRDGHIARQTDFVDLATLGEIRARAAGTQP